MAEASRQELLIATIARLLEGCRHVAVGAASPIPAAGALLARELSPTTLRVSLLGSRRHNPFTDGSRELFDCAAQGRIDAFFLSGAQIDGAGNVNLLGLGPYPRLHRRFAGCFGAPFMAELVPQIILFRADHDPRILVERVDFKSASGDRVRWLLTGRCLFRKAGPGFALHSLHPGETVAGARAATGFAFEAPGDPATTPAPSPAMLALIRGPVLAALAEVYPRAAGSLLADRASPSMAAMPRPHCASTRATS
jgi:glutaconate CoA-transferase subunit B